MGFRIKIIQELIEFNEKIYFYPKLRKYYKQHIKNKDGVILDVGTNKGQFINFIKPICTDSTIYGFEPNPTLYKKNLSNFANFDNIHISNIGISDIDGTLIFHENVMDETSTFEQLNFDSSYLKKKARVLGVDSREIVRKSYEVKVERLCDWIIKMNIQQIELLKIDVEGHEYNCLLGLFSQPSAKIRFIQIESHSDDMYENRQKAKLILPLLIENGYEEVHRIKHGFGDFYEIIFENKFV